MKKIFTGQAYSYTQGFNVLDEIKARPAGDAVAGDRRRDHLAARVDRRRHAERRSRPGSYTDRVLTVLSLVGRLVPAVLPRRGAALLPRLQGRASSRSAATCRCTSDPWQWFTHLILPWFTLSVLFIGFYSRVLRSTILDTINEDYVRTARAKGLSERQVLLRHVAAQLA